jgi:very-short-patch-repair endonuclease
MRLQQTVAEKHAWHLLRDRRALGLKFRRQVPIGDFIVDFYCHELKLVIEIDGDVHGEAVHMQRDETRNKKLNDLGYTVLRFSNAVVINDADTVLEAIRSLRPSPGAPQARHPLPEGEGA